MKKTFTLIISLFIVNTLISCTTAVISGKYTNDGRPLIWKLRDSHSLENKMMYFNDGRYDYIGLVNSEDITGKEIWAGANSKGFSIMNSASYNVNLKDTTSKKDCEGYFMKLALQNCATLEDLENLLDTISKPRGLATHFGVIDARGGAAIYEVNNYTYTKFDANNSEEAPNGYIIRTNFSFTGEKDTGYGFIRYQTAKELFHQADSMGQLNYKTIIKDFSRCLKHSLTNKDFRKEYEKIPEGKNFINSGDLITRNSSASAIIIQGVKNEEPGDLTTIWSIVGYPNTCVALPLWVRGGKNLPPILMADKSGFSPLNKKALELKNQVYPIKRGSGSNYLLISKLINSEENGIIQKIEKAEKNIFIKTEEKLKIWRKKPPKQIEITEFYNWLNKFVINTYSTEFNIEL